MNITLTGGTGFIGRHLVATLIGRGDQVTILSRGPRAGVNPRYVVWDGRSPPLPEALAADAIVHLAGESVAQRWSADAKRRIRESRVEGTRALVNGLAKADNKPGVLISASAIGIYGPRGDEVLTEASAPGSGFLEQVTIDWEHESRRAMDYGVRVVNPRIGVVLGRKGGALERMLPPFKAGVGGRLGSGEQWMSWIHIDDIAGLILFALEQKGVSGAMNATAPAPVRNAAFTDELARVLKRPAMLPVPAFALKLLFGEMAGVILASQRVIPEAATRAGYQFKFPELAGALQDVLTAG